MKFDNSFTEFLFFKHDNVMKIASKDYNFKTFTFTNEVIRWIKSRTFKIIKKILVMYIWILFESRIQIKK